MLLGNMLGLPELAKMFYLASFEITFRVVGMRTGAMEKYSVR